MTTRLAMVLCWTLCALSGTVARAVCVDASVNSFGAKGDGHTDDTAAIQSAINAASSAGGGSVVFGVARYFTTGTRLRSSACQFDFHSAVGQIRPAHSGLLWLVSRGLPGWRPGRPRTFSSAQHSLGFGEVFLPCGPEDGNSQSFYCGTPQCENYGFALLEVVFFFCAASPPTPACN